MRLVAFNPPEVQPSRMTQLDHLGRDEAHGLYAAEVVMRIGPHARFGARMTSAGLLSVGMLVSGILLATAVVVNAARRNVAAEKGTSGNGS